MAHAVRMPKPGQMTEECVLSMWRVAEGEPVAKGDVIFEIETDKSTMEVESFHEGVLLRQVVPAGETVPVNAICAWIGEPGEAVPEAVSAAADEQPSRSADARGRSAEAPRRDRGDGDGQERTAALAAAPPREPAGASAEAVATGGQPAGVNGPATSPRAARRARAAGIDLRAVVGSGPGGRVVERDVLAAIAAGGGPTSSAAAAHARPDAAPGVVTPEAATIDEEAPRPLSRMRRVIAERLASTTAIPTFSATVAVDVTRLLGLRDELRGGGVEVSVTDLVLGATARTLAEFPDVNARTDGESVWPRQRVHLGMAVAVPAGLVVAVIRDAHRLDLLEIHAAAERLAAAARDGTLPPDDMTGSTFTVSNLGMYGIEAFSAIVNPGESGILAVGAAVPTPVAVVEGLTVRTVMRLTLTADHRLVDGELGARFLGGLRRRLEDPDGLRRELDIRLPQRPFA